MAGITRKKNESKFADGELVVCVEGFVTAGGSYPSGTRRRVDELVRRTERHWLPDGSTTEEIGLAKAAFYAVEEPAPSPAPVVREERRLRDEDALVHVPTGERIRKGSKAARKNPDDFVPVIPPGLKRADALLVGQTLTEVGDEGAVLRVAHAGTWIHKDDPFAALHPDHMLLPKLVRKEAS